MPRIPKLPESDRRFGKLYAHLNLLREELESLRPMTSFDSFTNWGRIGVTRRPRGKVSEGPAGEPQEPVRPMVVKGVGKDHYRCREITDLSEDPSKYLTVLKPLHLCGSGPEIDVIALRRVEFNPHPVTIAIVSSDANQFYDIRNLTVLSTEDGNGKTLTLEQRVFPPFQTEGQIESSPDCTKVIMVRELDTTSPFWLKADNTLSLNEEGAGGSTKKQVRYIDTNEFINRQWFGIITPYELCQTRNGVPTLFWAPFEAGPTVE